MFPINSSSFKYTFVHDQCKPQNAVTSAMLIFISVAQNFTKAPLRGYTFTTLVWHRNPGKRQKTNFPQITGETPSRSTSFSLPVLEMFDTPDTKTY